MMCDTYFMVGAMMFVAWAGLIPISTAIAKHAHHWGVLWFRLHVSLNSLAAVLMLVAFIIMVVMQGAEFDNAHSVSIMCAKSD